MARSAETIARRKFKKQSRIAGRKIREERQVRANRGLKIRLVGLR